MKDEEFKKLMKKDRYQVFLFSSPASVPFNFWVHTWFVTVNKGKVSRWEVLFRTMPRGSECGHLYLNAFDSTRGVEVLPYYGWFFWKSKLIGYLEGKTNSVAEKMVRFLENSPKNYPYCNEYSFLKANSNTFTQRVLDKFSKCECELPWNAFGKNYKD